MLVARFVPTFLGVAPDLLEGVGRRGGVGGIGGRGYIYIIYQYIVGTYRNIGYVGKESTTCAWVLCSFCSRGEAKKMALLLQGHWGDYENGGGDAAVGCHPQTDD